MCVLLSVIACMHACMCRLLSLGLDSEKDLLCLMCNFTLYLMWSPFLLICTMILSIFSFIFS